MNIKHGLFTNAVAESGAQWTYTRVERMLNNSMTINKALFTGCGMCLRAIFVQSSKGLVILSTPIKCDILFIENFVDTYN